MGSIGTWQLVIVLAIVLVLFGAKRLPEAARGLGRSLKIFKTETQGLINNEDKASDVTGETPQQPADPAQQPQQQQRAVEPPSEPQQPAQPVNDQSRHDA